MIKKGISRAALLCCGISMLSFPTIAFGQDGASEEAIPDIIVTATRRQERLQDVAMSVNVVSGEQLAKLKIFDVKDVQQLAPGLELTNTSGRNNTTTLRGITFDPDQGTGPAVQVYYNEIPTDAQTVYTAIYDIQQIEVLRGPQGLLRGLSAPAGSITISTRRPNFNEIEGYAQATATTRSGYNVQTGISLPFSDKLAIRVAALVDGNRGNNVRNVNRDGERSRSRTESFRTTLGWKPSDDFTAYLTYQYLTVDNKQFQQVTGDGNTPFYDGISYLYSDSPAIDDTISNGPALTPSDYAAVSDGVFRLRNNSHILNLAWDWNLGASTLSFAGAHQFSKLTIQRDLDVTNAIPDYIYTSDVITPYKVDTAELRWTSNAQEGFGWGLGAFYTKQTGTTIVDQRQDTFLAPIPFYYGSLVPTTAHIVVPTDTQTWSFSGNLRYKSGPLKIEGGLRYTINKVTQTTDVYLDPELVYLPNPIQGIPTELQKRKYKPLTGGLTIDYGISRDLNVYFAYGHSYRAGSAGVALPSGISDDLILTQPEKTDAFEVGLKGSLADRRFNYSVAAFYQKLDNFLSRFTGIYIDGPYNDAFADVNYNADARIKGIEASFDGRPTDNWNFSISGAYTHARFKNALVPCNDFAGTGSPNQDGSPSINGSGNVSYCTTSGRVAETPDFSMTASTEVRMPMGSVTPFIRALFTYRPGFHSERVNYDYRSRELLNLFLGVRSSDDRWEFDIFARNLLNQKRITNISLGEGVQGTYCAPGYALDGSLCNGSGLPFESGYRTINTMNPREFGMTLNFKW